MGIDLIWQNGRELIPIEIKSSQTFGQQFIKNLKYFKSIAKDRVRYGYLVYAGNDSLPAADEWRLINYREVDKIIVNTP